MNVQLRKHSPLFTVTLLLSAGLYPSLTYSHEGSHSASCATAAPHHNLGAHQFTLSSGGAKVQNLFNQGINWAYGFNHAEAEAKFRAAAAIDSSCAMCQWGIAYVLGPNINAPMSPDAVPKAYEAIQKAQALSKNASPKEKAYIEAMSKRYAPTPSDDRSALDRAYADAMMQLAQRFPDDLEAAVLAVEARMDTMPWNYWLPNGQPQEGTEEMIAMLNRVLEKDPLHPGANHFLIHIVEKVRPELGEKAADTLVNLVPDSGHLQHMASHIYIRVGRYRDAILANERGIKADQTYMAACPQDSLYQLLYVPHNYDFLVAAAYLEGNQALAVRSAIELRKLIEPYALKDASSADLQQFWSTPYAAYVRFGQWQQMLDEPEPRKDWTYARSLWHFGRALASARTGDTALASKEVEKLEALANDPKWEKVLLGGLNPVSKVLGIALSEARAELARALQMDELSADLFADAVAIQDSLVYIEPPIWYHSMRLPYGYALLKLGRNAEAQAAFEEDLKYFPRNGWALDGLYRSLKAQNLNAQAEAVQKEFKTAWQFADFDLSLLTKEAKPGGKLSAAELQKSLGRGR